MEYVPAPQLGQTVATVIPRPVEYLPTAQLVHKAAPVPVLYVLAVQGVQLEDAVEPEVERYVPRTHIEHTDIPVFDAYVPAGHCVQGAELTEYDPGIQDIH